MTTATNDVLMATLGRALFTMFSIALAALIVVTGNAEMRVLIACLAIPTCYLWIARDRVVFGVLIMALAMIYLAVLTALNVVMTTRCA